MTERPSLPDSAKHDDDFDDPQLEIRLKSLLTDVTAPSHLVQAVERTARHLPLATASRSPWAELLPALASLGLVGSLLMGALGNLPFGDAVRRLLGAATSSGSSGGGTSTTLIALVGVGLPIILLLTIEILRGAPILRRVGR
ncbi:MAG: hypothetical protein SGI90_16995 [Candidatus Eisenbacteria bacterium]|nr:hypothetical protein [Candidatus Eisenbacteria bacterium]